MSITSILNKSEILNYINSLNLDFFKPQVNHLKNLVTGIISINSKINISNLSKTVLNSKDTKYIESLGYYFSHTKGKSVWGHCIVSSQLVTKTYSIPLDFKQYLDKNYCKSYN